MNSITNLILFVGVAFAVISICQDIGVLGRRFRIDRPPKPQQSGFRPIRRGSRGPGSSAPASSPALSRAQVMSKLRRDFRASRQLAQVQAKSAGIQRTSAGCPCTQMTCKEDTFTVTEGSDNGVDLCYVIFPPGGYQVTECTLDTYLTACTEVQSCGCSVGTCQDYDFRDIDIFVACIRGPSNIDFLSLTVSGPQGCCCLT